MATKTVSLRSLTKLAKDYMRQKRDALTTARKAEKLREQLAAKMVAADVEEFTFTYQGASCEAVIGCDDVRSVDVNKLFELVETDDFVEVVTATQKRVKEVFGEVVLASVIEVSPGEEKLRIREIKE